MIQNIERDFNEENEVFNELFIFIKILCVSFLHGSFGLAFLHNLEKYSVVKYKKRFIIYKYEFNTLNFRHTEKEGWAHFFLLLTKIYNWFRCSCTKIHKKNKGDSLSLFTQKYVMCCTCPSSRIRLSGRTVLWTNIHIQTNTNMCKPRTFNIVISLSATYFDETATTTKKNIVYNFF